MTDGFPNDIGAAEMAAGKPMLVMSPQVVRALREGRPVAASLLRELAVTILKCPGERPGHYLDDHRGSWRLFEYPDSTGLGCHRENFGGVLIEASQTPVIATFVQPLNAPESTIGALQAREVRLKDALNPNSGMDEGAKHALLIAGAMWLFVLLVAGALGVAAEWTKRPSSHVTIVGVGIFIIAVATFALFAFIIHRRPHLVLVGTELKIVRLRPWVRRVRRRRGVLVRTLTKRFYREVPKRTAKCTTCKGTGKGESRLVGWSPAKPGGEWVPESTRTIRTMAADSDSPSYEFTEKSGGYFTQPTSGNPGHYRRMPCTCCGGYRRHTWRDPRYAWAWMIANYAPFAQADIDAAQRWRVAPDLRSGSDFVVFVPPPR